MTDQLSVREQVDQILEEGERRREDQFRQVEAEPEIQRQAEVTKAKEAFRDTVVRAARNGSITVKLLELDDKGAPESYRQGDRRNDLRSEAYRDFWDFVVEQGFTPVIENYANEDGVGSWNVLHSDSDWIVCVITPPRSK
jgi:aspartyl-tRNA synthetase